MIRVRHRALNECFLIRKRNWLRVCLLSILSFGLAPTSSATTVVIPSDEDLIIGARAIVTGRVLSVDSAFDETQNTVFTYVRLRVKEVLKGRISGRELVLKEPGGEVAGRGSALFGTPQFVPGEKVLLYLDTWSDGSLRVHQMFLGKFRIQENLRTGMTEVVRETAGAHVEVLGTSPLGAATSRMELASYERMVRRTVSATYQRSAQFEAAHYNGVPILQAPREYEAVPRNAVLQPQFRLLFNARWFEPDEQKPVKFFVNPDGAPSASIMDDVAAAMNTWSTVPGCSLRVVNGGTTRDCLSEGVGIISFNAACFPLSPSSGVLAFGGFEWDSALTKTVNGVVFRRIIMGRVAVNPNAGVADSCEVREVVTHEMGHALGLHHSWDPTFEGSASTTDMDATMYFVAHFDGRCASLRPDDMNGIRFIYPGEGSGSSVTIVTPALPVATTGQPYTQQLDAIGGSFPYNWSLAPGSRALPAGLGLAASGLISGAPSAEGSFTFTARVTDSASGTADKDFAITVIPTSSPFNSKLESQVVPPSAVPGQAFTVSIFWRNTGLETWSESAGVRIGSQNPPDNTTWGGSRVVLPRLVAVGPGQRLQISFTVFAPNAVGTFDFQFQLLKEGVGFFGEPSPNTRIMITPATNLSIEGASSLETTVGAPVDLQLRATGGVPPYIWTLVNGELPGGLSLGTTTGRIFGSPVTPTTTTATVKVIDSGSRTGEATLSFRVNPPPVEILTSTLPFAIRGLSYSQLLEARGGVGPYGWSLTAGQFPPGLAIDQASGMLMGSPGTTGAFTFTVAVTDSSGSSVSKALALLVVAPEDIPEIGKLKYKSAPRKLIVTGANFHAGARLLVDDQQVALKSSEETILVVKPLTLGTGIHRFRVINANGLSSQVFTLTVN